MSLFDFLMALPVAQKRATDQTIIPDRLYFKIGHVAKICDLETYVLRFWETEFPQLKPNKSGTGQRLYRRRDVELVLEIKRLVHGEGYTLAGARQALSQIQHGRRDMDPKREPQSALPLGCRSRETECIGPIEWRRRLACVRVSFASLQRSSRRRLRMHRFADGGA